MPSESVRRYQSCSHQKPKQSLRFDEHVCVTYLKNIAIFPVDSRPHADNVLWHPILRQIVDKILRCFALDPGPHRVEFRFISDTDPLLQKLP